MVIIILASSSPRRRELLEKIGLEPLVMEPPSWVEDVSSSDARFTAMLRASRKASYVYKRLIGKVKNDFVVIGADTIIVLDDQFIGKPRDANEAYVILKTLSGRWHRVYTGLAIISYVNGRTQYIIDISEALVKFKVLSEEEIKWYISTGEPFGAAGGYRVQDLGGLLVEEVHGDYYSVVGLPLSKLYTHLLRLGILGHRLMSLNTYRLRSCI